MADLPNPPRYKVGDQVRLPWGARLEGKVMEVTPALAPHAHTLYSVYVPMDPEPLIFLVRENEIEAA
jgi:hypothetical protein